MRASRLLRGVLAACALVLATPAAAAPARTALILYTHSASDEDGNVGRLYAIFLRNLIGHFPVSVAIEDADACTPAEAKAADALFFVGFMPDHRIAPELLHAIAARSGTTVWLRYGVDQFLAAAGPALGVSFAAYRGFDGRSQFFFDAIRYKGFKFVKYRGDDAEPALGVLRIDDPKRAQAPAAIVDTHSGEQAPYVTHSGAFWYVADLPFSYIGARDRYLVLADLLYDMLGEAPGPEGYRALVRLEDVHPLTQPQAIDRLSAYFAQRKIPFSIALIPHYKDPFGRSWDTPQDVTLADPRAAGLVAALKRAVERGGSIVQHGTTHQYGTMRNPNSAISGDDYEFWDKRNMRPIPALENEAVVIARVSEGQALIRHAGLDPFAFEVPHYEASPLAYRAIAHVYPVSYQEITYYSDDQGRLGGKAIAESWNTQFFPYVIRRDYYNEMVLPENLGDLQYTAPVESADDILLNADYAKAVRGGFASFFFHPFFLEGPDADRAMRDLDKIVTGIQQRGFRFVAADKLAQESSPP
jgi:uncharacterized protein YdaL